ncbi:hypothetical protein E0E53_17770 [Azotobacter chroococcum]|nr:hypothetical protein E0E53_17770 [Azotobacter chroococcum]
MFVFALLGDTMSDPLAEAESRFQALTSYRVTVRATAGDGERHVLRYFYRKPGWMRMEFVQPHEGMVLIYDPGTRRVRVWPFGLNRLPRFSFAPDNPLVRGPRGHRVDRSDIGTLLAHLRAVVARGSLTTLGETQIAARPAAGFEVRGEAHASRPEVQHYRIWLARDSLFPLRVEHFAADGRLLERVDMADVEIDVPLPERFFTP